MRHATALRTTKKIARAGTGVYKKGISALDTKPSNDRVIRSPRHDAIAGAILSGSKPNFLQRTMRVHIKVPSKAEESAAEAIEVEVTMM